MRVMRDAVLGVSDVKRGIMDSVCKELGRNLERTKNPGVQTTQSTDDKKDINRVVTHLPHFPTKATLHCKTDQTCSNSLTMSGSIFSIVLFTIIAVAITTIMTLVNNANYCEFAPDRQAQNMTDQP
jgi:hypothetical protein